MKPFSARVCPHVPNYSSIMGLKEHRYGAMLKVEQTLVSYISPDMASPLKDPTLPTRPCRTILALEAYMAAGQCLHTMAILQAYQANLPTDLAEGEGVGPEAVRELPWATDLSLQATKEMIRVIGQSMTALVATERHL